MISTEASQAERINNEAVVEQQPVRDTPIYKQVM